MSRLLGLFVFFFLQYLTAVADPSPFGITINKTTIQELQKKYRCEYVGINAYTFGQMYDLPVSALNFEGLVSARVICDTKGRVVALKTTVNKDRYADLSDMLAAKYTLVGQKRAFVGTQQAEFKDGKTHIFLQALHLSFTLDLVYIHDDFQKLYNAKEKRVQAEKHTQEMGKL